jgi:hypothetical protein
MWGNITADHRDIYISVIGCNISPHARGDKIVPSISSAGQRMMEAGNMCMVM